jgi:predicted DNA-binding WGR domain protein
LNGNKQGDEEEKWTYIGGRGETVIDYGRVNEEALERVEEFRIGERVESDHLEIALRKRRGGKEQIRRGVGDTNEKGYFGNFLGCYFMFGYDYVHCH